MGLCKKILSISFKEKSIFRFDYLVNTLFSFFYIVLKVYLWKGLYGISGEAVSGIALNDMLVYSILSSFTAGITKTTVMNDLNESVLSGSISSNLLLPIGLKKYLFLHSVTKNIFLTLYGIIPSVLAAMLFFGFHAEISPVNLVLYVLSVIMGTLINFLYNFLFGSSVIWFRNSFFLNNINSVLLNLFSGALVPLWFFPEPMKILSVFLPFRYIVFEPIAVLLNTKSAAETAYVFAMQLFWLVFLFCAATAVWNRGRNKIMIQGG